MPFTSFKHFSYVFSLLFFVGNALSSCNQANNTAESLAPLLDGIELLPCTPIDSSIMYSNVLLENYTYTKSQMMFRPVNLRLGGRTPFTKNRPRTLPKTNKGNHLHICIDNKLHHISNNNIFDFPLADGKYKLTAFIARSFYESIKNPEAIMAKEIGIRNGELYLSKNISTVDIVYNAPMGSHLKGDKILLDFVLIGTSLEKEGNQVKITINNQKSFHVSSWQAYFLKGLDVGTYEVTLELLDALGKQLAAPTSQRFTVKAPTKLNQ
ncbi:MAG: Phosphopeptide-binding protein [uncultured Aureispira sp.]|uniref:Phosphopeptide-binding protein n=1 Tax=uncultured Aureispira sp. TaxID=1331704 RepID=A0A6S6TXW6_9BACT|nr:MAG: Phosphopeptide-binding protein [uncultured Aureispira sp.]